MAGRACFHKPLLAWALLLFTAVPAAALRAQEAPTPDPPPASLGGELEAGSTTEPQDLDSRVRDLEEMNRRLSTQLEAAEMRHQEQMELLLREIQALKGPVQPAEASSATPAARPATDASAGSTGGTTGRGGPTGGVPTYRGVTRGSEEKRPVKGTFGQGLDFQTEDGEFDLQIHQETQVDYRSFDPEGDTFARDGFFIPRARIFFTGRVTKQWDYMFSLNHGFANNFAVLDAWLSYHPDDRFQFRIGRFMTPFNYEQYAVQNMWLIAPERSLFTSNLGLNRQIGAQLFGTAWDKRLDYAVGLFNGPRNSFDDFNGAKDVMGYLNVRPFQEQKGTLFEFLNVGGSFTAGMQDNTLTPQAWRVATNASNSGQADRAAPPFYIFDRTVVERGDRAFWSAHVAWFYKSLSVIADYNGANLRYASSADAPASVVIPAHGYSIAAGYFLTGEEVERRTILVPKKDFDLRRDKFGLGAWELIGRYSTLNFDKDILSPDLTDPELWSNEAWVTNLGLNWYPNRFVKIYLDWQHAEFGGPVAYSLDPVRKSLTNDMLWLRAQFYF
jgi:phosphate-selective porin OprO/OprP